MTILLVEDNPDDELLTRRALAKNNVANDIVVAADGEVALDYLFGRGEHKHRGLVKLPALVLLDLNLPKVSGHEVLRQIRANTHTKLLPVVILTTSKEEQDIAMGYSNGVNSYVRKPVNFHDFVDAVQQLCVYWLLRNEPPPRR